MANTYHVNVATRMRDALFMTLLRAGAAMGTTALLTVRGRTSGRPHTVPVIPVSQDGQRFLVAPYGVVQWVRNLRAAGTATLTRGRRAEAISVTELPAQEAALVLEQYLVKVAAVRPWRLLSVRHRVTRSFRSRRGRAYRTIGHESPCLPACKSK
jgi:deazaflavin-dependent oxidoreductase (nitroreductase family)